MSGSGAIAVLVSATIAPGHVAQFSQHTFLVRGHGTGSGLGEPSCRSDERHIRLTMLDYQRHSPAVEEAGRYRPGLPNFDLVVARVYFDAGEEFLHFCLAPLQYLREPIMLMLVDHQSARQASAAVVLACHTEDFY